MMQANESVTTPRVGIISMHPAPYRDPTFVALHRRKVIDFKVLTLFDLDPGHTFWGKEMPSYPNVTLAKCWGSPRNRCFHPQIASILIKNRFEVIVIPGYYYLTSWFAILYCLLSKTPFIFSGDRISRNNSRKTRGHLAAKLLHLLLHTAAACWVPGQAARRFLHNQGVKNDRVFAGCYTLDHGTIAEQLHCRQDEGRAWRERFAIPKDGFLFLMVANLLPKRRHDLLLQAFSRVVAADPSSYLLLVGQGCDAATIPRLCNGKTVDHVRLAGPVDFTGLVPFFAGADAYVHSGGEPYSTAIAYGAIAGLPIVTTPHVGAAADYVVNGKTGFIVDSEDVAALAEKMLLLARNREKAALLGRNARQLAREYTPEWAAQQFEQAVAIALPAER